jgi:formylglycine-generating enzyme required for sulfatase activity
MVVIPGPVEFVRGSPPTETGRNTDEQQHRKRIGRTIAIAAKPVTVKQYLEFDKGYLDHLYMKQYAPTVDCPVHAITWFRAAAYCNWLSDREGIPKEEWCYETDSNGQVTRLQENYLSRTGYRLPTEAEWEYACRAGAMTSRYYGETTDLLEKYAWFVENSRNQTWPVGSKKPNDFGLFDMQGNVYTWCQESYKSYPPGKGEEAIKDKKDVLSIVSSVNRVQRGGSFSYNASNVRSANRQSYVPENYNGSYGFRPARTFR